MWNWIAPDGTSRVLYKDGNAVKCFNQSTLAITTLLANTNGAVQIVFADLDVWVYFCGYDANDNGTFQARIYDGTNVDIAFRGPLTWNAATVANEGAGYTTAGRHYFGFVYQNRTGYAGVPTTALTFAISATTNANPDVITATGNTLNTGDTLSIAGATGDTAINGSFTALVVSAGSTFKIINNATGNPVAGNGAYTGGGVLTVPLQIAISYGFTITATSNASTDVITAPGNNLNTGDNVTISGSTGDTAINGTFIAQVISQGSTFSLTDGNGNPIAGNGAYTGGGSVVGPTPNSAQIDLSVTLPALTDGGTDANGGVQATLFLIATPANNSAAWFFIPNNAATGQIGEQSVPHNSIATLNFVMNVSDFDMNASYDSALANFLFLSQDGSGNGPFNPNWVSVYGTRMVFGNGTTAYASELDNPQQIAADLNAIVMPNQRQIALGFQLPNSSSFYFTGDRWTAYVTDNGDTPSTWPVPTSVSNALGAPFPHCVYVATGGNNAWIATAPGVYAFNGTYAPKPLTFMISDLWRGINWTAISLLEMADDIDNLRLYVSIPYNPLLPNAPSQILVFDYQNGSGYDQCDITFDLFGAAATAQLGSVAVVRELNGETNVWVGPPAAGNVVRYDTTVFTDQGNAISSFWISGLLLGTGEMTSQMIRVGAADVWMRGSEAASPAPGVNWYGPDNVQTMNSSLQTTAGTIAALTPSPGLMYFTNLDFPRIENVSVGFGAGSSAGDWFSLSGYRVYYKPDAYNR
jgi:hypothetical protein